MTAMATKKKTPKKKTTADVIPIERPIQDFGELLERGARLEEAEFGPPEGRRAGEWVPKGLSETPRTAAEISNEILRKFKVRVEPQSLINQLAALTHRGKCVKVGFGLSATYALKPKPVDDAEAFVDRALEAYTKSRQ